MFEGIAVTHFEYLVVEAFTILISSMCLRKKKAFSKNQTCLHFTIRGTYVYYQVTRRITTHDYSAITTVSVGTYCMLHCRG